MQQCKDEEIYLEIWKVQLLTLSPCRPRRRYSLRRFFNSRIPTDSID